jgi:formamidopyrimidine-DNA glycosylase
MIELPEAVALSRQINATLKGKTIAECVRGNAPHKFAFYNRPPEEYAALLPGLAIGAAYDQGSMILVPAEPGYALCWGGGGERIIFHPNASTLPPKHQFLLRFRDETYLTVTVQMWGSAQLYDQASVPLNKNFYGFDMISPLSEGFSEGYFLNLFSYLPEGSKDSIKFFMISKPGVWGVGNGYLQDILFRARLHPRRRALETSLEERRELYRVTTQILRAAVEAGGRVSELDLFGRPGGYVKILDSASAGQPCPVCGTPIEKISFLGGASYLCPICQK